MLWARRSKDVRYILMSLYAFDLEKRSVRRLPFPERVSLINPTPRNAPVRQETVVYGTAGNIFAIVAAFTPNKKGNVQNRL